jgi:hypothetical protein
MAEKNTPNVVDGFGNSVRLNEDGLTITAAKNKNLDLEVSGSGEVTVNGSPISGGAVSSVFGRTGDVVAEAQDYTNIPDLLFSDDVGSEISFQDNGVAIISEDDNSSLTVVNGEAVITNGNGSIGCGLFGASFECRDNAGNAITAAKLSPGIDMLSGDGLHISLVAGAGGGASLVLDDNVFLLDSLVAGISIQSGLLNINCPSGMAISLATVPIFANNAAAISGGLSEGSIYRTGADPDTLCIVH